MVPAPHNVFGLDVSVDNIVLVEVPKPVDELPREQDCLFFRDGFVNVPLGAARGVRFLFEQLVFAHKVHNKIQFVRRGVVNN